LQDKNIFEIRRRKYKDKLMLSISEEMRLGLYSAVKVLYEFKVN
jgi:hypothetical protein